MKRYSAQVGIVATSLLTGVLVPSGTPHAMERGALAASVAPGLPPGAPMEDIRYADEWPAPNGNLSNTRVAHSTIASTNVAKLGVAWTLPLSGAGSNGYDVANPVIAAGIAYLQDGASNVMAVQYATGKVLWMHQYNSPDYGPNGVTIADGRIYGVTATGVFALDAKTGRQVWYNTHLAAKASFLIAPQVANGKVFVASALTVGGGSIYALDAQTGATVWRFQNVVDTVGRQLPVPAGGAWDAFLIGPDYSLYAGIGNPYLSQQEAQATPRRELYTDSILKLSQATGKLEWYYQAFPDDFHDWDLQISPIYTAAAGRPVVLAAGKGGFVFAFEPANGKLLWKTSVGIHNGHDDDDQLALEGKLHLKTPYTLYPGIAGGVETNMAAADGVVYVPVVNLPARYTSAKARVGRANFLQGRGEMVALDLATGKQLWATRLPQLPLGGATVSNDLVFTTTLNGELIAISRKDGSIVWTGHLPAGSNATLAIAGNTLLAGAGVPLTKIERPMVVAYQLGAKGRVAPTPAGPAQGQSPGATRAPGVGQGVHQTFTFTTTKVDTYAMRPSAAAAAPASPAPALACAWPSENSAATYNEGDDSNAAYWRQPFVVQSNLRIVISGRYLDLGGLIMSANTERILASRPGRCAPRAIASRVTRAEGREHVGLSALLAVHLTAVLCAYYPAWRRQMGIEPYGIEPLYGGTVTGSAEA